MATILRQASTFADGVDAGYRMHLLGGQGLRKRNMTQSYATQTINWFRDFAKNPDSAKVIAAINTEDPAYDDAHRQLHPQVPILDQDVVSQRQRRP
ncbi:MAG: hypothetical protein CMH49_04250 [Myxococcales bacterium]|nr:hypothetical protein [Myxococcales bacterium]